jgi:hypothetical protein
MRSVGFGTPRGAVTGKEPIPLSYLAPGNESLGYVGNRMESGIESILPWELAANTCALD